MENQVVTRENGKWWGKWIIMIQGAFNHVNNFIQKLRL